MCMCICMCNMLVVELINSPLLEGIILAASYVVVVAVI